jgi:hypothetical protein
MNVLFRKEVGFLTPSQVVVFVPGYMFPDQSAGFLRITVTGKRSDPNYEIQMKPVRAHEIPSDVCTKEVSEYLDAGSLKGFEIAGWLAEQVG